MSAIDPVRLRGLLRRLIEVYSPSGKEEEIVDLLHEELTERGLDVVRQEVEGERVNLLVVPREDCELVLIGHVDTVVAHDYDELDYAERGDEIFGLGAADMKGGCAAMIEAYTALTLAHGRDLPVALALVVGEEEAGDGACRLMESHSFPWAIIGEPTELVPCLANFGYIEVHVETEGKRRHASLADRGIHAVANLLELSLAIVRYLENTRPDLVFNIRDLWSSQAGFAVPESGHVCFDIHLPPAAPLGEIVQEFEDVLAAERARNLALDASMRFPSIVSGFSLPEKGPMVERLRAVYAELGLPFSPTPFRSHSDANVLWEAGTRPVILGPGRLESAHAVDESVPFYQVQTAAEIYLALGRSLCR